ncbi:hypothetical protein TPCV302_15410 [Cutibacterium avidum]|nr:hypothetical protein TPCV302_15410 [Cutibacterium avidum]
MRAAVIGAGAIGAFYGGVLADAGADVSFVARGKTLEAIRGHGLRIVGNTEVTLDVPATDNSAEIGQVDVVLMCTKTFQVADAARTHLSALMGPDTLVVTTQNGVIAPRVLAEIIGAEHVAPGVCREWVKIIEPGLIMDLGGPRMLEVSTMDDSPNPIIDELRAACETASIVSPRHRRHHHHAVGQDVFRRSPGSLWSRPRRRSGRSTQHLSRHLRPVY